MHASIYMIGLLVSGLSAIMVVCLLIWIAEMLVSHALRRLGLLWDVVNVVHQNRKNLEALKPAKYSPEDSTAEGAKDEKKSKTHNNQA